MRQKSDENWQAGSGCLAAGHVNAAASRIYYAVFQAVLHFARTKRGYDDPGHGAHSAMARVVWNTGMGSRMYGRIFSDLMRLRETADYDPESVEDPKIRSVLNDADTIRKYFLRLAGQ